MSGHSQVEPTAAYRRERQRDTLLWALADLEGLLARGVIDVHAYRALRRDYEERLHQLGAVDDREPRGEHATLERPPEGAASVPPTPPGDAGSERTPPAREDRPAAATIPAGGGAGHLPQPTGALGMGEAVSGVATPPVPGASRASGDARSAGLLINLTLVLGAFFVVMATLIFARYSGRLLGGIAKTGIITGFAAAFLGVGALCLRLPKVRPAGHTFLAIGALLTPLAIVAGYTFVLRERGLSSTAVWAWGSTYCALFYALLTLLGLGRAYAVAAVLGVISAWGGLLATLELPESWTPVAILLLPTLLLVAGRLIERTALGRASFGPSPAIAAQLLTPPGITVTLLFLLAGEERAGSATALGLATLFYGVAAWSQPDALLRKLHLAGALATGSLAVAATGYAARIPARGYAALVLAGAWFTLALFALARRRAAWAPVVLAASLLYAALLLLPWGFLVTDRHPWYWTAVFAGVLLYTVVLVWDRRRPWGLYPVALAAALTLFHALRIGIAPRPYPYAWAYALVALLPVAALPLLRRRGVARAWDRQLVIIGQIFALAALGLALAGADRRQLALVLWLFTVAGGAIVAAERREELLALPNFWALGAVAATLALAGVERRWAPATFAGVGVALAAGLHAWRTVPRERRGGPFMAHRWSAGVWAVCGPTLALWLLRDAFARFLATGELRELVLDLAYGPAGLATALCGAALSADALMTLRRPTGYGASAVIAAAALMGIARITPNNPQAYAVPLGLYLLALSVYVAYEHELGPVRMPAANSLIAAAIIVILGTTFVQSLVHPWRYTFLGLGEGLALLAATLFLRRRYGVALTLSFLVLTTLRAAFDVARSLPNWVVIGLLGLALLGTSLLVLVRRDRFERWSAAAAARWSRLM